MSTLYCDQLIVQNQDICSNVTVKINDNQSANTNNSIQLPADVDDTLVGVAATQTLTNKTFDDTDNLIVPQKNFMYATETGGARAQWLYTYPFNMHKIGKIVHLQWTTTNFSNATATSVFYIPTGLPDSWLPTRAVDLPIKVKAGASVLWGNLRINAVGDNNFEIGATPDHGNFTSGQACGWYQGSAFYIAGNE